MRLYGFIFYGFLISNLTYSKTIHIFGDSHASHCFKDRNQEESFMYSFLSDGPLKYVQFKIHWLGSIPMVQLVQEKTKLLNIREHEVSNGDVVVFVFGEIDVRYHIGPELETKKLSEFIDDLVAQYFEVIYQNVCDYDALTVVVMCVIPPIDSVSIPYFGFCETIARRLEFTDCMNSYLKKMCQSNGYYFLDIYDLYAKPDGTLNNHYADETVHINYKYNGPIKERLLKMISHY